MSRRALLAALGLAGMAIGIGGRAMAGDDQALATVANAHGLRFGSAMRASAIGDPALADLLRGQCASITPELEMKWAALAPAPDQLDFTAMDAVADFARAGRMRIRGHAALWHRSVPAWFGNGARWDAIARFIGAVGERYRLDMDEWDVVNEPIAPDGSGLRGSVLSESFGPGYIADALYAARASAPGVRLMINDYDLEYALPEQAARRRALLSLIRTLRARRAPLDGIGVQGHLAIGRPFDARQYTDFLDALAAEGLRISITEFDVRERDLILPAAARDAAVAEHAAPFLAASFAHPAVMSLTCWGLSDRQSWLEVTAADRARFPGAWTDGSSPGLNRGLPYDSSCGAKPLRRAIVDSLAMARR